MPDDFYNQKLETLQGEKKILNAKKRSLGIFRLGALVALIVSLYFLWNIGWWAIIIAALLLIILFTRLVLIDLNNKLAIEDNERLATINEHEHNALKGEYFHFEPGAQYQHKDHPYSNDLDIFGHATLFQYLNRSFKETGSDNLTKKLEQ